MPFITISDVKIWKGNELLLAARTIVFTIWLLLGRMASAVNVRFMEFRIVGILFVLTPPSLERGNMNQNAFIKTEYNVKLKAIFKNTPAYAYLKLVMVKVLNNPR